MEQFLRLLQRPLLLGGTFLSLLGGHRALAQVVNDECTGAIPITLTAPCTPINGSTAGATQSLPPTNRCSFGNNPAVDVWYSFVAAGSSQNLTIDAPVTNFIVEVFSGTCGNLTSIVCGTTLQQIQAPGLTSGQTYFIRVHAPTFLPAPTGQAATFTLCLTSGPPNDEPCGALAVPLTLPGAPAQPVGSTTVGATTSTQTTLSAPGCSSPSMLQDVWFTITPPAGSTSALISTGGTGAGLLRVYTTTNCTSGPLLQVSCHGSGSVLLTNLIPGQTYYLAVSGSSPNSPLGPVSVAGTYILSATRTAADARALVVFPNPSPAGQLTLRRASTAAGQATLLNTLGQVVLTQVLPAGSAEQVLDTHGLRPGLYTLRVQAGAEALTRQVVLE